MVLGVLFAVLILAKRPPIPSEAVIIKATNSWYPPYGTIERSTSIPPNSKMFKDVEEILASIWSSSS